MSTSTKQLGVSQIIAPDAQNIASHKVKQKNFTTLPPKIKFPFRWKYGRVTKLSETEQQKLNAPRGRKHQCKPCAICGSSGGNLTHRKISDGNSSLICTDCAISYIQSAMKISHVHGFNNRGKKKESDVEYVYNLR